MGVVGLKTCFSAVSIGPQGPGAQDVRRESQRIVE